jgi:REP element-mobilizing transposase RayT
MTTARQRLISLQETTYYHCISRCVRRTWLCGKDPYNGKSFDHRRQWMLDRFRPLSAIFSIEICAYAILSNHYHLVLHVSVDQASEWSDVEVAQHWMRLYKGHHLVERYQAREPLSAAEWEVVSELIEIWRNRLFYISWFMRCLNEHLAQRANQEDQCRGRFWEGCFKSQALLDETAVLTCMSYVDLNPIRAGIADTPEESDFISFQERIRAWQTKRTASVKQNNSETRLRPFVVSSNGYSDPGIEFSLQDYLELVDWTGRAIRDDKKGAIPNELQPVMQRLGVELETWLTSIKHDNRDYFSVLGALDRIKTFARAQGRAWCRGQEVARRTNRMVSA